MALIVSYRHILLSSYLEIKFCFDVLSSASFPDPNTCFVGQCYMLLNVHHHIKNWVKDACSILQDSLSRLKRKSQQAGRDSARVNSANFDPVVLG